MAPATTIASQVSDDFDIPAPPTFTIDGTNDDDDQTNEPIDMGDLDIAVTAQEKAVDGERSMVSLSRRLGKRVKSPLWVLEVFKIPTITEEGLKAFNADDEGSLFYPGLNKVISNPGHVGCCMICYANRMLSLDRCLFTSRGLNPANFIAHLRSSHRDNNIADEVLVTQKDKMMYDVGQENENYINGLGNVTTGSSLNVSGGGTNGKRKKTVPTQMEKYYDKKAKESVEGQMKCLMYEFISASGTAIRQGESEELNDLLCFCVANAKHLEGKADVLKINRRRYLKEQIKSFHKTILIIKGLVSSVCGWFKTRTGSHDVPFVYVQHDIWDSKQYEVLGVSITIPDPETCTIHQFAVGCRRVGSHKAEFVVPEINQILSRFGISHGDISVE